jgi:nucleotide-binding universal stress UspA family protein
MFNSILVPLDGSELAEVVLPHASALGRTFDANIILVRVIESPGVGDTQPVDPLQWQIMKREAANYLYDTANRLQQAGVKTEAAVLEGQPAGQIVEYSQNKQVDLILLSSHGRSGLSRWNISSITRKIIQNAKRSTMVVRAYQPSSSGLEEFRYQRLLIPLDGSIRSEYVMPIANLLAEQQGAEMLLVHVVYKPEMPRRKPLSDEDLQLIDRFIERNRQEAVHYLEQIVCQMPIECHTRLIISDNVENSLHDLVEQEQIDLVLMSAHGYSGSRRQPFGNVTTNFIEYGSSHLLIVQDIPAEEVEPTRAELAVEQRKGH